MCVLHKGDVTRDESIFSAWRCNINCYDVVWSSYNIVPTLQRCVALKIVIANCTVWHHLKGDITRNDSQRRFLTQQSVAMLEQCCEHSKQFVNNVGTTMVKLGIFTLLSCSGRQRNVQKGLMHVQLLFCLITYCLSIFFYSELLFCS